MNIENLTIKQVCELFGLFNEPSLSSNNHPYQVGANYFIRTVTYHLTGRLKVVYDQELVLEDAAWIADSGRFAQAVESGTFAEVEPWPNGVEVIVNRSSITDVTKINYPLPRSQK